MWFMWWVCYRLKKEFGRRVETLANQKRVPSFPSKSALESNLLKLKNTCLLLSLSHVATCILFIMFMQMWIMLWWSKVFFFVLFCFIYLFLKSQCYVKCKIDFHFCKRLTQQGLLCMYASHLQFFNAIFWDRRKQDFTVQDERYLFCWLVLSVYWLFFLSFSWPLFLGLCILPWKTPHTYFVFHFPSIRVDSHPNISF